MPNLDIKSAVTTAFFLAVIGGIITLLLGYRTIRSGMRLRFFRKRRDRIVTGWRFLFLTAILWVLAFAVNQYAEPIAYRFYPPTPTITLTPTVTLTPTISLTPTITLTPTVTETPSVTDTPSMPFEIAQRFEGKVTPNPDSAFSRLQFATEIDPNRQPVNPATEFVNPVGHMYGTFSFDGMQDGVQWSALWLYNGKIVFYESLVWNGGTGGYGYTDWNPPADAWLPGEYEIQIFIGMIWVRSGRFTVTGDPPAPTATISPTPSYTFTATPSPSPTGTPTRTPRPSLTPTATPTPRPTSLPSPTP
jgi:type VI secretion system secreted protein VgrG